MLNPTLRKKEEEALTLEEKAKRLFQIIYNEQNKREKDNDDAPKIRVSALISRMAFYYEKIRNSVDYKEEHFLRKNAIERILKRQIVIEGAIQKVKSEEISRHLLTELIRADYLPNNKLPESKIGEIAGVTEKYLKLKRTALLSLPQPDSEAKKELNQWILSLMACDIEERLGRNDVTQAVFSQMYEILSRNIELPADLPYEEDKKIQIYLSVCRNFLKYDRTMLSFVLFKYYNNNWPAAGDQEIEETAKKVHLLRATIERQLNHPLASQFNKVTRKYTVFFTVLVDVISEDPKKIYESFQSDPSLFSRSIKRVCERRYKKAKAKVWRAAVRSIIYIFLTKSFFALLLEIPATKWLGEEINPFSLAVNISFPAILLFAIVLFTRLPSEANTRRISQGIGEIVFSERQKREPQLFKKPAKRGAAASAIFGTIYIITFLFSCGLVVWFLRQIHFSFLSIVIFLFFLAFVSFFSVRIRRNAQELIVVEAKENIFTFLSDFFYMPIVAMGKWLSERFSRLNVFVFVLDFIIETPFKIFVEVAEEWMKYVKERKDEIV